MILYQQYVLRNMYFGNSEYADTYTYICIYIYVLIENKQTENICNNTKT